MLPLQMHMCVFYLLMFSLGLFQVIALVTAHSLQLDVRRSSAVKVVRMQWKPNLKFEHVFLYLVDTQYICCLSYCSAS